MILSEHDLKSLISKFLNEKVRSLKPGFKFSDVEAYTDDIAATTDSESLKNASDDLYDYLNYYLTLVGQGSSRAAFIFSNKYTLKLAHGYNNDVDMVRAGIKQNENEVLVSRTSPQIQKIIPNVIKYDNDFIWIISELVKPIDKNVFEDIVGLSYNIFKDIMLDILYLGAPFSDLDEIYDDYMSKFHGKRSKFEKLSQKTREFITLIYKFCKENRSPVGDLISINSLGKTSDGRVVVFDYGLNDDIGKDFYGWK